jgi:beta-galactosidase
MNHFANPVYGGDYNPEQWPEELWLEDARLMREAGVNLVSLGVFAWSRLEPRPGEYDFDWLDRAMDLLHAHGIGVNLATATASPPPWLSVLHPESLPVRMDGTRDAPGSRQAYCPSSPAFRAAAAALTRCLAERYRAHPALKMWHVGNEYGCHTAACYCEHCAQNFRAWLQTRYANLETLNAAWTTDFWSQRYGDWAHISPPRQAPYMRNPAQVLDWERFSSDNLLACFEAEARIVRAATPDVPVATNFMGFFKPLDYWRWSAHQDLIANDIYPDPTLADSSAEAAMTADLMRSLARGKGWLIMEQVVGQVQWRARNALKRPGQMRLWSYQALARGARGVMFFQWRASKGGAERFHGAMLGHSGTDSRVWREVRDLGQELRGLRLPAPPTADVAILHDWESWWALEGEGHPARLTLMPLLRAWYAPLYARNVLTDFAHPDHDLRRYKAVLVPNLHLLSRAAARNLEEYVAGGGTVLVGAYSGIVDTTNQVHLPGYPGALRQLLGLHIEEFDVLAEAATLHVNTLDGERFQAHTWADVIHLEGAQALARFSDGFAAGQPAVTEHRFGRGRALYIGTQLHAAGLDWALERTLGVAGVDLTPQQPGVECVVAGSGEAQVTFWLNHNPNPVSVRAEGRDVLTRRVVSGTTTLEGYGVLALVSIQKAVAV